MNILFLSEVSAVEVIGGAERVLREQALGLHRRGHQVSIVARAPAADVRPMVAIDGVTEHRYPVSRGSAPAFAWSSAQGAYHAARHLAALREPDALILHQALPGLRPVLHRSGRPPALIYVCHSLAHEEFLSRSAPDGDGSALLTGRVHAWIRRNLERVVIRRCDRVVVLSEFMRRRVMQAHGVSADRIRITPGGADLERFCQVQDRATVRNRLALPAERIMLFTVRNLVLRMGLEALVTAIAALQGEFPGLLLLVGGEGPLRSTLEAQIRELGLKDRVRLLGFVAEKELPLYYQAADLVLMPTKELEGFGLVTVEALACGAPVLGTPVGAIPEILSQVDPALVADASDAPALARALGALLRRFRAEPGLRPRLATAGRQLVEARYNWTNHVAMLESILQGLLDDVQGRPSHHPA
jgi:glycosyltransferase involved in cell wall biosynthesis